MSKISQLQMELTEQAYELGFNSLEEALINGYEVDYEEHKLVNPYVLEKDYKEVFKEYEKAHKAWEKEKQTVIGDLKNLLIHNAFDFDIIKRAIEFIEKGEV